MELAFLLRGVGADVQWITNQRPSGTDSVIYSLEHKMLNRGVQVAKSFCAYNQLPYMALFAISIFFISIFYYLNLLTMKSHSSCESTC